MDFFQYQPDALNEAIKQNLDRKGNSEFLQAACYAILPEGHRYRGIIGLEAYELLGGRREKFMPAAVGIEFIHQASLIVDDLPSMDNSSLRKGKPSTHVEYDEATAILAALYLQEKGRHLLFEAGILHLLPQGRMQGYQACIHKTLVDLLRGQQSDLYNHRTKSELFSMMLNKNKLFQLACTLPAMLLKRDDLLGLMKETGALLSTAYQLFDDLRDIESTPEEVGKPTQVDRTKKTSVYVLGNYEVWRQLEQKKEQIQKNLGSIQSGSRLETIIKIMLSQP